MLTGKKAVLFNDYQSFFLCTEKHQINEHGWQPAGNKYNHHLGLLRIPIKLPIVPGYQLFIVNCSKHHPSRMML